MDCHSCKYQQDEPGTSLKRCRAIKEHPSFRHMSLEEKGALEISTAATGRFPYTDKNNVPLIEILKSEDCYWPNSFDPSDILDCRFHKLIENPAGWVRIK